MVSRIWLVGLVIALAGCAGPQLYHGQLAKLDKGIAPETVAKRFEQPPLSVHKSEAGGRSFEFHRFMLNNGLQSDLYILAYEQNRLLYWGYISEFRRLPDADLNTALSQILPPMLGIK